MKKLTPRFTPRTPFLLILLLFCKDGPPIPPLRQGTMVPSSANPGITRRIQPSRHRESWTGQWLMPAVRRDLAMTHAARHKTPDFWRCGRPVCYRDLQRCWAVWSGRRSHAAEVVCVRREDLQEDGSLVLYFRRASSPCHGATRVQPRQPAWQRHVGASSHARGNTCVPDGGK